LLTEGPGKRIAQEFEHKWASGIFALVRPAGTIDQDQATQPVWITRGKIPGHAPAHGSCTLRDVRGVAGQCGAPTVSNHAVQLCCRTMKPFRDVEPATLAEASALLLQHAGQASLLAGGTDLLVEIKEQLRSPEIVINIKNLPELRGLEFDPAQGLFIGAMASS
jgi:hypothetical protein